MPLLATPGTRFSVVSSNSGQMVVEAIVQRLPGQSYQDYARAHVLIPGGIDRTDPPPEDAVAHRYGNPGPDGQRVDLTEQGKDDGTDGASGVAENYRAMNKLPGRVITSERSAQKLLGMTPRGTSQWLADIGLR